MPAMIYGPNFNWKFIKYCLTHKEERFVIVGWSNKNTRLLIFLFFILGRPFNFWTDMPTPLAATAFKSRCLRWSAHKLLKYSKANVFAVGSAVVNYFRQSNFSEKRLINLPVFVETYPDLSTYHAKRELIYSKYNFSNSDFVLTAGSRLIYNKGYDLLIKAIAKLDESVRQDIKVIIVGNGDQAAVLQDLVVTLQLTEQVIFESWLSIDDFKSLIANSHVFIHPARLDAYGGATLGMSMGVPVIGSYQAGAASDRINHQVNGFLYQATDIETLADLITQLFHDRNLCRIVGYEGHKTSLQWSPQLGKKILIENVI